MNEYGTYRDASTNEDTEWRLAACVVRLHPGTVNSDGSFTTGGPYIYTNEHHVSVGPQSVSVNSEGELVIQRDGTGPIGAAIVCPDEILVGRQIMAGCRGGLGTTKLWLAKAGVGALDLSTQAHWDLVSHQYANLWVLWTSPSVRGVGDPSKADQALAAIAALTARVEELEGGCS